MKTLLSDHTWEHFDDLRRLDCGAVEDPCRVNPQPGHNPGHSKTGKKNVAGTLVVGVLTHLGRLERTQNKAVKNATYSYSLKLKFSFGLKDF